MAEVPAEKAELATDKSEIKFENGKPTGSYDQIIPCFKDHGNGLLFRCVNGTDKQWAFYNDTTNYNMVVRVAFGKDSQVTPLGNTKLETCTETGEHKCEVMVPPMQTEMFIEGVPNGFKINFEANPIPK